MEFAMKTDRLCIVPFEMKYLEEYYSEFDEEITRYQYPDPFDSIAAAKEALQGFIDRMEQNEMLFLSVLTRDGEFAGGVEVYGLQEQSPELGIWIKKRLQQNGYAYEALKIVLEFVENGCHKDWCVYEADVRNQGSIKLVEKFQCKKEGIDELETETGKPLILQRFLIKNGSSGKKHGNQFCPQRGKVVEW